MKGLPRSRAFGPFLAPAFGVLISMQTATATATTAAAATTATAATTTTVTTGTVASVQRPGPVVGGAGGLGRRLGNQLRPSRQNHLRHLVHVRHDRQRLVVDLDRRRHH